MRIYEIANAEEQLGLLRLIIDNTWTAIAQQAAQKKQADAEKKAKEKIKPRRKTRSAKSKPRLPPPIKTANADTALASANPKSSTNTATTAVSATPSTPKSSAATPVAAKPILANKPLPITSLNSASSLPTATVEPALAATHQTYASVKPIKKGLTAHNPSFTSG